MYDIEEPDEQVLGEEYEANKDAQSHIPALAVIYAFDQGRKDGIEQAQRAIGDLADECLSKALTVEYDPLTAAWLEGVDAALRAVDDLRDSHE